MFLRSFSLTAWLCLSVLSAATASPTNTEPVSPRFEFASPPLTLVSPTETDDSGSAHEHVASATLALEPSDKLPWRVAIKSKLALVTSSHGDAAMEAAYSAIYAGLGFEDLRAQLASNSTELPAFASRRRWGFDVAASFLPTLVKDRVHTQIDEQIREKSAETLSQIEKALAAQRAVAIPQAVAEMLAKMPDYQALSPAEQRAIRGAVENAVSEAVDQNVAAARMKYSQQVAQQTNATTEQVENNIDHLYVETSIQKVAMTFVVAERPGFVAYTVLGKTHIGGSGLSNDTGESRVETDLPLSSYTEKATSTMGTGAVEGVVWYQIDDKQALQLTGAIFHNRPPVVSGEQLVSDISVLSADEFERHQRLYELDSFHAKGTHILETENAGHFESSASFGVFRGNPAVMVGEWWKRGQFEAAVTVVPYSEREFLRKAYLVHLARSFWLCGGESLIKIYAGFEHIDDLRDNSIVYKEPVNLNLVRSGTIWVNALPRLMNRMGLVLDTQVGVEWRNYSGAPSLDYDQEWLILLSNRIRFRVPRQAP